MTSRYRNSAEEINPDSQTGRILQLLRDTGAWIPAPELVKISLQYNARILELRRAGYRIENRLETVDGVKHGYFRLVPEMLFPIVAAPQVWRDPEEGWR